MDPFLAHFRDTDWIMTTIVMGTLVSIAANQLPKMFWSTLSLTRSLPLALKGVALDYRLRAVKAALENRDADGLHFLTFCASRAAARWRTILVLDAAGILLSTSAGFRLSPALGPVLPEPRESPVWAGAVVLAWVISMICTSLFFGIGIWLGHRRVRAMDEAVFILRHWQAMGITGDVDAMLATVEPSVLDRVVHILVRESPGAVAQVATASDAIKLISPHPDAVHDVTVKDRPPALLARTPKP